MLVKLCNLAKSKGLNLLGKKCDSYIATNSGAAPPSTPKDAPQKRQEGQGVAPVGSSS